MITYSWRQVFKVILIFAELYKVCYIFHIHCSVFLWLVKTAYKWPKSTEPVVCEVRWGFSVRGMNKARGRPFRELT